MNLTKNLYINQISADEIGRLEELPHSLILTGKTGVGILTIAKELAGKDLAEILEPKDKDNKVDRVRGSIKIEAIRELHLATRSVSSRRVIIIDDANKMTVQAQNAFLKLLEEPNLGTHFIMTSHHLHELLPTVLSRAQKINIRPIDAEASNALIKKLFKDSVTQQQVHFIANGLPAEITRLSKNPKMLESTIKSASIARQFISMDNYQKLTHINELNKTRESSLEFIKSLEMILMHQSLNHPSTKSLEMLDVVSDVHDGLIANFNVKAQMLKLLL